MPSHYTDVEKLLLERWPDVRALLTAYGELQDSIEEMLTEAGEELEKWADGLDYSFETDARGAEFSIWKEAWANRKNDAGVWLAVGGFVPDGYRKVKANHPYIWVYIDPDNLRIRAGQHEQFARDLRASLGEDLKNWQDPDVQEHAPLGKTLKEYDDAQRLQWMTSPTNLIEFVKGAFEQLVPLAAPIDKVVKAYK